MPYEWPREFDWPFIGQQFQRGYDAASGDWVIHADLDFVFHEKTYDEIRQKLAKRRRAPALAFLKYQFLLADRYSVKSKLVIAVNKAKYGSRIAFNGGGDLCQPTLDGKLLDPSTVKQAKIPFYNYDFLLKTKEVVKKEFGRFARAWARHTGRYEFGGPDDDSAFECFLNMKLRRFAAQDYTIIPLEEHPRVMWETLRNLGPENFGYSAWGHLETIRYVSQ